MQRYHARRKLAVQRMEREVEEKIAQLAVLEQENRQLKWQAHILENMLLDMDKQVGRSAHLTCSWQAVSTPLHTCRCTVAACSVFHCTLAHVRHFFMGALVHIATAAWCRELSHSFWQVLQHQLFKLVPVGNSACWLRQAEG